MADGETYVLDLAAGLTQVLADTATTYLTRADLGFLLQLRDSPRVPLQPSGWRGRAVDSVFGASIAARQGEVNHPTTTYLYGAMRIGAQSTTWTYYHADALGSVRALSDASGQPISAHAYSPYGDPTTAAPDDFGYTGEQVGAGGLVYLRARYYDPGVGVFLSHDPWSGDVMRPASLNGWSYVEGNPVNWMDASGECRRPDGTIDTWRWPFFNWGPCPAVAGVSTATPSPTATPLFR